MERTGHRRIRQTTTAGLMVATVACMGCPINHQLPPTYTEPVIHEDLLVFGRRDADKLYAVDRLTGQVRWTSCKYARGLRPTVVDGILYSWVSAPIWGGPDSWFARACAVDCATGKDLWQTLTDGYATEPAVVCGDVVLFPAGSSRCAVLFGIERKTGRRLWRKDRCHFVAAWGDRALCTLRHRDFVVVDAATGQERKVPDLDARSLWSAHGHSVGDTAVLSNSGAIVAIDLDKLAERWRAHTPGTPWWVWVSISPRGVIAVWQEHLLDERRRRQDSTIHVQIRDLQRGEVIQSIDAPGPVRPDIRAPHLRWPDLASGVVDCGDVFVLCFSDGMRGFEPTTMRQLWHKPGLDVSGAHVHGGTLLCGGREDRPEYHGPVLYQLDPRSGEVLWEFRQALN